LTRLQAPSKIAGMPDDRDRNLARMVVECGFLTQEEVMPYWQRLQPGSPPLVNLLLQDGRLNQDHLGQLRSRWQQQEAGAPGGARPTANLGLGGQPAPPNTGAPSHYGGEEVSLDDAWEEALRKDTELARVLLRRAVIDQERLRECRQLQLQHRMRLGVVIVKKGYVAKDIVEGAISEVLGQPSHAPAVQAAVGGAAPAAPVAPVAPVAPGMGGGPPVVRANGGAGRQDPFASGDVRGGAVPFNPQDNIPTLMGIEAAGVMQGDAGGGEPAPPNFGMSVEELNPFAEFGGPDSRSGPGGTAAGAPGFGPGAGASADRSVDELSFGAPAFLPGGNNPSDSSMPTKDAPRDDGWGPGPGSGSEMATMAPGYSDAGAAPGFGPPPGFGGGPDFGGEMATMAPGYSDGFGAPGGGPPGGFPGMGPPAGIGDFTGQEMATLPPGYDAGAAMQADNFSPDAATIPPGFNAPPGGFGAGPDAGFGAPPPGGDFGGFGAPPGGGFGAPPGGGFGAPPGGGFGAPPGPAGDGFFGGPAGSAPAPPGGASAGTGSESARKTKKKKKKKKPGFDQPSGGGNKQLVLLILGLLAMGGLVLGIVFFVIK
jgi:hypothetical protein